MNSTLPSDSIARRFGGIARLVGDQGFARLREAHVGIIGIGGVGSWLAESLARSAIGSLTLIDMDVVAESNINRQILADSTTLGRDKIAVMADRIKAINPDCQVHIVDEFLSTDNLSAHMDGQYSVVVDCIDDFRIKAALISYMKQSRKPLLVMGGAGGQIDATKVRQADLSRTQHDVLLARTRKLLRQDYRFPKKLNRSFGVPCIYSDEQLVYPDGNGGITPQRPSKVNENVPIGMSNALNCAGGLGSITHVTATFAMHASSYVINRLVGI